LHFVHGQEFKRPAHGHGFHCANEIPRIGRHNFFFAGDERRRGRALGDHNLVVDFPGQQPQRKTDNAGAVAEHALDRQMSLTGVGGAENRGGAERALGFHGATRLSHTAFLLPFRFTWLKARSRSALSNDHFHGAPCCGAANQRAAPRGSGLGFRFLFRRGLFGRPGFWFCRCPLVRRVRDAGGRCRLSSVLNVRNRSISYTNVERFCPNTVIWLTGLPLTNVDKN